MVTSQNGRETKLKIVKVESNGSEGIKVELEKIVMSR